MGEGRALSYKFAVLYAIKKVKGNSPFSFEGW